MEDVQIIHQQVGEFTEQQLQNLKENLESYVHPHLSLFVPIYRFCEYAVSPNHSHPAYSFIYTIKQKGKLLMNGVEKPNPYADSSFVCAFSPNIPHQETVDEGFSNYIAIFIDKQYFESCLAEYGITELYLPGNYYPANNNLLFLLKMLMLEYNKGTAPSAQIIGSLNNLIAHLIIRLVQGEQATDLSASSQDKVELAIAYMYEHVAEKLSVNDIAAQVNSSPSHFSKLFKDITNKSPIEYLAGIRIERAKRLLKLSDKNLTEIAFECGFSSSSYFSHSFIERVRLTPSEYRKKFAASANIDKNS